MTTQRSLFGDMPALVEQVFTESPDEAQAKDAFEKARCLFRKLGGDVRGLETEWAYFKACHKKTWKDDAFDLEPAIHLLERARQAEKKKTKFYRRWGCFKTWILNRKWEEANPE